ncbi:MAG: Ca2+-dependent phosphoinositide-specific phospholipase C [Dethiobacteria bacterium]|jgi:hypothetical protein
MRRRSRIGLALLAVLGITIFSFTGLVIYFSQIRINDIQEQAERMAALRHRYQTSYTAREEQEFVNFDLIKNDLRLNEIQLLATHNSYKKLGSAIAKAIIWLGNRTEANALKYHNNNLTEQLDDGVRSFELDLRCRKGDFEVIHAPLMDNSSTCPRFELALEEILLWSLHNPGHIPLVFLLELKGDWMFLDPALHDFTSEELSRLDGMIKDTFGEKLFSPGDLVLPGETLNGAVRERGWPLLKDLRGKVIFILHPGRYTESYLHLHPTFMEMAAFPASQGDDTDNSYASFIVHNDPCVETINRLISENYIVRTRLDCNLIVDEKRFRKGLASGAQILTTDYGPNHNFEGTDYVAYPEEGRTVIANPVIVK